MSSEPAPANPVPKNTIDAGMYLGFGCLIISAVVLIISGLIFFSGYRMLQYNADPATRLRVAKNILATEALPEGFHPTMAMAMPDALQMVVLTDDPAVMEGPDPSFKEMGLAMFRILSNPRTTEGEFVSDFLTGKQEPDTNDDMMPAMYDGQSIGKGTITAPQAIAQFDTHRGTLQVFGWQGKGVVTRFVVECNAGGPPVFGLWFMREPIYSPTPKVGNSEALSAMLQPMKLCVLPE